MSQSNSHSHSPQNNPSSNFVNYLANSQQIFQLIDSILPIESCIHHKILPLQLKDKYLSLGMLNPEDLKAINSVRTIASSFGYYLNIKAIDAQTYQLIVDNYFQASTPQQNSYRDRDRTVVDVEPKSSKSDRRRRLDSAPTIISPLEAQESQSTIDSSMTLTEIPSDFDFLRKDPPQPKKADADSSMTLTEIPSDFDFLRENPPQPKKADADSSMTLTEIPSDFDFLRENSAQKSPHKSISSNEMAATNLHEKSTLIVEEDSENVSSEQSQILTSEVQISNLIAETEQNSHNVHQNNPTESSDFLADFTSRWSWEQLFEKSLKHNIERVNLKLHRDRGSIVCIENEQVKSSLEQVTLSSYGALVEEIKALVKLPSSVKLQKIKKVAIERFHQKERVILRLAFIPNQHGLDITIDILRNEVLQDYEQKQMDKMSAQALSIAQKLEQNLKKMKSCFPSAKVNNLRELQNIQRTIDSYLKLLNR